MNKKLLSIIITAYKSEWIIGDALESIYNQNINDDLEIIISDDCSDETYDFFIKKYQDLDIKVVKTDYNCCPGNTRQRGLDSSSGEWITFMDADDVFYEKSLQKIKKTIKDHPYLGVICTPIRATDYETGDFVYEDEATHGVTHGNFYKKEFLDLFHISYKKDMVSHEDIYFTNLVKCALFSIGNRYCLLSDIRVYNWRLREDSLSNTQNKKDNHVSGYIEEHFEDYVTVSNIYIDYYKNNKTELAYDFALSNFLNMLCYSYFFCQSFIFYDYVNFIKKTVANSKKMWDSCKQTFGLSSQDIYGILILDRGEVWNEIRKVAMRSTDFFIEPISFVEWIEIMDGNKDIEDCLILPQYSIHRQ